MGIERRSWVAEKLRRAFQSAGQFAAQRYVFNRPFSKGFRHRLLLVTIKQRIPQSQIFPFHFYSDALRKCYDAEIREISISDYQRGKKDVPRDATVVCFQTQFDVPHQELTNVIKALRDLNPDARFVYLDWFAPTDFRLAEALDPYISFYVKKHVLRDRSKYYTPTFGDTNLVDYYSKRFGLPQETKYFPIPPHFFDKLLIGPSFATADFMLREFLELRAPERVKTIDIHARLGVRGTDWYQKMRSECMAALGTVADLDVALGAGVSHIEYLNELRKSKICFSPFGYGEVCWRDYEAVMSGSVLLKPDMSHIETNPDVFVAGQTYMPVRWDLADFEGKIRLLIESPNLRAEITNSAFSVLHSYLKEEKFVKQFERIFA